MNEFNPFDELGITFDDDGLQENRRDRSYNNKYNPFDMNKDVKVDLNTEPEYQPDFSKSLTNINNPKDLQVSQELGIVIPEPMNEDEKQAYVDSLSNEDWKTWKNLRDEGYSFEARKAMFDNREDLYDITEPGNKKFWSGNKNSFMQYLLDQQQDTVDFQEDVIHPWSQTIEDWLDVQAADLMDYSYDEIKQEMYDNAVNPNDNNLVKWMRKQAVKPLASVKRGAAIAGGILFDMASKAVDLIDNLGNISTQLEAWALNSAVDEKKGYDLVINDPEKEPTIWGSYVEGVADTMGIVFTRKFPIATWILTTVGSESDFIGGLMDAAHNGIKGVWKRIDKVTGIDKFNLKYLTPEEQEEFYNNQATATWILFAEATGKGLNRWSKTEAYQRLQQAMDYAKKTSKVGLREGVKEVQETKQMMEQQPEGTEFRTEGGTKFAEVTSDGVQTTPYGALRILQKLGGRQINGWIRGFEWFYKNRNKLITRDPNTPIGELPVVQTPEVKTEDGVETPKEEIKPTEEIKEETPKEEVKTPKTGVKTTPKTVAKKVGSSENQTIGEYIKKISNEITGKKGGMDKDLFEKFSASPDLQNEYVNTIDPYIKSNGGENPSGVIEHQLNDFVETVKDQLKDRRNKNIDFRKGQMKYKVQIPESDRVKWEQEDREINNLIKTLSRTSSDPEKFLDYLLKLPEEKTQALNKLIPNFSKNLELIKDTLDLTKAITSKDLLGKFLQYKSTWGTRRKNFIRRYLWRKINEGYKKAGVKRNMYEIEKLLNKLSEEQLVELEEIIDSENNDPAVMNSFVGQVKNSSQFEKRKKRIGTVQEKLIPESAIFDELTEQGYRNDEFEYDRFKSDKEKTDLKSILNTKYSDGTTPQERIDFYNIGLEPLHPGLLPWSISAQSLENGVIQFRNNLESFNAWVLGHEIRHQVKGRLTTKELFDFYNNIIKSTKSIKLYEGDNLEEMKGISEYMGLEKTRTGIEEYVADSFAQILIKGDLHELEDFLSPTIRGLDLSPKVNKIFSKICKDLWDNLSAFETENGYSTQVDELKKMIDKVRPSKENVEMSKRRNYQWSPMSKTARGGIKRGTDFHRLSLLQNVNPELSNLKFNLDLKSDRLGSLVFEMEDGRQLNWDEFKNTLTEEQMKKFEQDPVLSSKEWEEAIKNEEESIQASMRNSDPLYEKYQKEIKNIDADIIGLTEKDGKIYVKYLIESQQERYELPDRPGYVELKEVPAKDYFTEEELNKLPKELKDQILGNEEKDVIQLQKDLDYWHHRAMKAEKGTEDTDDYLDLENRKYDENVDIEQIQKDIDYRHHRAMVAERGGE